MSRVSLPPSRSNSGLLSSLATQAIGGKLKCLFIFTWPRCCDHISESYQLRIWKFWVDMTCNVMHEGHAKKVIGVHFLQIYRAAPLRHGALQRPLHWIFDHKPVGPQTPRLPTPQNTVSVCHRSGGTAQ